MMLATIHDDTWNVHNMQDMIIQTSLVVAFTKIKIEREIKFIGLFVDRGHRGPYSPYKLCDHNL